MSEWTATAAAEGTVVPAATMSTTMPASDRARLIRWIALANAATAASVLLFWVGFHTEVIFPVELMSTRIENFAGYYAWETSFVVPDVIMAVATLLAAARLVGDPRDRLGTLVLAACAGSMMFLGVLDFTYDVSNGMYSLGHFFSWILLSIGVGLPILGVVTIWGLSRHGA